MQGTMKTAVMTGLKELEWEQRPIPVPSKGEVLVRVEHVGICGSDLHYYEQGAIGDFKVSFPFVLGHEAAGTVVEIGEGVTDLAVGDRVAMEPGKTCGQCITVKPAGTTYALMWNSLPRLPLTGCSVNMWPIRQACASVCRKIWIL